MKKRKIDIDMKSSMQANALKVLTSIQLEYLKQICEPKESLREALGYTSEAFKTFKFLELIPDTDEKTLLETVNKLGETLGKQ